jgi:hypothetical protein
MKDSAGHASFNIKGAARTACKSSCRYLELSSRYVGSRSSVSEAIIRLPIIEFTGYLRITIQVKRLLLAFPSMTSGLT